MPFTNPEPEAIRALLQSVHTIAVVGYSPKPARPSHSIARRMQEYGYRVIPVRPGISEGLGEKAYRNLAAVPETIDLVNVFRASEYMPEVVEECIQLGVNKLWMQENIWNEAAAARAQAAGITVIMDRCILRDYNRLCLG